MNKNKQGRRRGDELLEAIYEVTYQILETEGYKEINFTRIAREAKTSRSVLYRYWDTTFDLVFDTVHNKRKPNKIIMDKLDFDYGNLRSNLMFIGEDFILTLESFPKEFYRIMLSEMIQHQERSKKILLEATTFHNKLIDYVLQLAIDQKEITKWPPVETKLSLFQLIRYAFIVENEIVSKQKLESIIDYVVLPAILSFSQRRKT
ncbi:TetR family transcriptional regulator [Bacillus sp. J14TS2]|uniref:TetR/AcrR family transcriptional regulator n=1 Tax=Bacillus sp. J14TS2 TaxID=2807188 RepID=UPI001B1CA078|nr:TetR/AcrR family transcriptional regulator [Bacillus sp. J14TS2]GIN71638.1 TetR family transcriptional regulator [Bacillus sp. J14TS2]